MPSFLDEMTSAMVSHGVRNADINQIESIQSNCWINLHESLAQR